VAEREIARLRKIAQSTRRGVGKLRTVPRCDDPYLPVIRAGGHRNSLDP
jgi:hypothetical protein